MSAVTTPERNSLPAGSHIPGLPEHLRGTIIKTKVWMERGGRFVIGDGGLKLLLGVLEHGSLLGAAKQIGWSYRHAWGYLKQAEAALGTPLTTPRPGKGASRGMEDVQQSWRLPPGSAVLYGFYTHPRFRGRGLYASALRRMLTDVAVIPGLSEVYIGVRADNEPSRRVIEKVGFVYDRSFYERRRLVLVRRWAGASDGGDDVPTQS